MLGYTIIGSLPLLWGILNLWGFEGSVYTQFFYGGAISQLPYYWSFLFVLGFIVKLPVYGVHMWLPKAHVEAPLGGSILLAGLLLKLGGYGLYLILGAIDNIGVSLQVIHTWAIVGGCYAGLLCLTQTDLKSLIAYTSISHIAIVVGSLISGNVIGATTIIISHGFTSSALFVFAYTVYKFRGSRSILVSKGLLGCRLPLAILLFLLAAFNLRVPPRLNFMGEVIARVSLVEWSWVSRLTIFGLIFLRGAYRLVIYSGLCHGSLSQVTLPGPILNTRQVRVVVFHLVPSFLFILKLMMFN